MTAAAREMQGQHDPASTVETAVRLLLQNVEGCNSASISLVHRKRRVEVAVSSDDLAASCDRLQHEMGEGPCIDAIWDREAVEAPDLTRDPRWPDWGPRAAGETGALSVMTFRLFTTNDLLGALSMYSTRANAFSDEDRAEGLGLAAHIAIALAASRSLDQFEAALDSRAVIGQACGLIMERFDIDAVAAFSLLTRLSSTYNVRLRDIALELIRTRLIPPPPAAARQ